MKKRKDDQEIVVKRRSRREHVDESSESWKVAFADFTMAMMALFMVLWIVQPQNNRDAPGRSVHLANPLLDGGAGVFDGTSKVLADLGGVPLPGRHEGDEPLEAEREVDDPKMHFGLAGLSDLQELAELMRQVASELDAIANIEVEVVPQGLRILIKDDQRRFMFQRGSAVLNSHFHGLLTRLASVLARVDNKLIISGHTDSTPYRGDARYNNWNLSGDRALRARNVLVEAGLPAGAILQVTAQADGMPIVPDEPENGANRRIELLLLTAQAELLYQDLFGERGAQAHYHEEGARYLDRR